MVEVRARMLRIFFFFISPWALASQVGTMGHEQLSCSLKLARHSLKPHLIKASYGLHANNGKRVLSSYRKVAFSPNRGKRSALVWEQMALAKFWITPKDDGTRLQIRLQSTIDPRRHACAEIESAEITGSSFKYSPHCYEMPVPHITTPDLEQALDKLQEALQRSWSYSTVAYEVDWEIEPETRLEFLRRSGPLGEDYFDYDGFRRISYEEFSGTEEDFVMNALYGLRDTAFGVSPDPRKRPSLQIWEAISQPTYDLGAGNRAFRLEFNDPRFNQTLFIDYLGFHLPPAPQSE